MENDPEGQRDPGADTRCHKVTMSFEILMEGPNDFVPREKPRRFTVKGPHWAFWN